MCKYDVSCPFEHEHEAHSYSHVNATVHPFSTYDQSYCTAPWKTGDLYIGFLERWWTDHANWSDRAIQQTRDILCLTCRCPGTGLRAVTLVIQQTKWCKVSRASMRNELAAAKMPAHCIELVEGLQWCSCALHYNSTQCLTQCDWHSAIVHHLKMPHRCSRRIRDAKTDTQPYTVQQANILLAMPWMKCFEDLKSIVEQVTKHGNRSWLDTNGYENTVGMVLGECTSSA